MTFLSRPDQIWVLKPTKEDLIAGAEYAALTLPWTFNRMMLNTGVHGQQARALNIAKGVVGQEMLRRELARRGVPFTIQSKSHRNDDLFDLRLPIDGKLTRLDLKSMNYFTDYPSLGRQPLSRELIIENANYPGPDWRRFFPMLVPHTQIGQEKEAYCFAIASSIDFRRDVVTNRIGYTLTAFPYGEVMAFLSSKRLCLSREEAGKGFYISSIWKPSGLYRFTLRLTIVGEWAGNVFKVPVDLEPDKTVEINQPFSCVSSFQINEYYYERWTEGQINIWVSHNDFTAAVLSASRRDLNMVPQKPLTLRKSDFCNLVLPTDYTLYVLGWITKEEFLQRCRNYIGWVWPIDSVNKFENRPWTQITKSDEKALEKAGFLNCIQSEPRLLRAGWMKTNGHGGGACCYVYPNIGPRGGVKETNLYVLPQDLHPMEELGPS